MFRTEAASLLLEYQKAFYFLDPSLSLLLIEGVYWLVEDGEYPGALGE